jgi:DNA repair protein RadC
MDAVKEVAERIAEGEGNETTALDLLSVVLGSQEKARKLYEQLDNLPALNRLPPDELRKAVGKLGAIRIAAALELGRRVASPAEEKPRLQISSEVARFYQPLLGHLTHEVFHVACLNVRNKLVKDARIAQGGFASCAILPREVFAPAMREGCVGVVLVHNHPSGETDPSADDLQLTHRLVRAGEVLGIRVLDHVIIGSNGYTSLRDRGQLS